MLMFLKVAVFAVSNRKRKLLKLSDPQVQKSSTSKVQILTYDSHICKKEFSEHFIQQFLLSIYSLLYFQFLMYWLSRCQSSFFCTDKPFSGKPKFIFSILLKNPYSLSAYRKPSATDLHNKYIYVYIVCVGIIKLSKHQMWIYLATLATLTYHHSCTFLQMWDALDTENCFQEIIWQSKKKVQFLRKFRPVDKYIFGEAECCVIKLRV